MSISVTPQAAAHIAAQGRPLRVRVTSGGCSGLRYVFDFEDAQAQDLSKPNQLASASPASSDGSRSAFLGNSSSHTQERPVPVPPADHRIVMVRACSGEWSVAAPDCSNVDADTPPLQIAVILVDPLSMVFMQDSTLDYRQELMASCFVMHNPKAQNGCGCGESFSMNMLG